MLLMSKTPFREIEKKRKVFDVAGRKWDINYKTKYK